jgi:hypothetical protein
MTDAPETIWAWVWNTPGLRENKKNSWCDFVPEFADWVTRGWPTRSEWGGRTTIHKQTPTEYTRTDVAQARIAQLEAFASELLDMMDWWGTGTSEVAKIEEKEYRDRFAALKAKP